MLTMLLNEWIECAQREQWGNKWRHFARIEKGHLMLVEFDNVRCLDDACVLYYHNDIVGDVTAGFTWVYSVDHEREAFDYIVSRPRLKYRSLNEEQRLQKIIESIPDDDTVADYYNDIEHDMRYVDKRALRFFYEWAHDGIEWIPRLAEQNAEMSEILQKIADMPLVEEIAHVTFCNYCGGSYDEEAEPKDDNWHKAGCPHIAAKNIVEAKKAVVF